MRFHGTTAEESGWSGVLMDYWQREGITPNDLRQEFWLGGIGDS
jgi:hypothetical protein